MKAQAGSPARDLVALGEISTFITKGSTPTTYGFKWERSGVLFLRSECVSERGLDLGQSMFISDAANNALRRSRVEDGDILLTITGNVGRVIRLVGIGEANINQHIARIRIKDPRFDRGYVYHYLAQQSIRKYYESIVTGQAYPQISLAQVRNTKIPVPPIGEQRAIAAALNAVDDFLVELERLIAKKEAIKIGTTQQLLTGRTRLPGFDGEWAPLRVAAKSELKARIGWQGLTTAEYRSSGTHRLVGGTEFADGSVDWEAAPFVDEWRYDQDTAIQLREGDVLLTKDGSIGKTAYVDALPGPATLNSGVFVLRPLRGAYDSRFLYFMLRSRAFEDFLTRLSAGSTISHLYQRDLVKLVLDFPPTLEEQDAIASVLWDMDSEVTVLRARLAKFSSVRAGMMQELLTGRTRLPMTEAAA